MIGRFTNWLREKLSPVSPELSARLARIDAWIASMPPSEAREHAFAVLANTEWFETLPGSHSTTFPAELPAGVRELYARYRQPLWGYLLKNCQDEAAAGEMFQDVWLRVISSSKPWICST